METDQAGKGRAEGRDVGPGNRQALPKLMHLLKSTLPVTIVPKNPEDQVPTQTFQRLPLRIQDCLPDRGACSAAGPRAGLPPRSRGLVPPSRGCASEGQRDADARAVRLGYAKSAGDGRGLLRSGDHHSQEAPWDPGPGALVEVPRLCLPLRSRSLAAAQVTSVPSGVALGHRDPPPGRSSQHSRRCTTRGRKDPGPG
ncbi:unnamed protein product [Rangifer tarandus platyrhynchus]|uniref:Uncharacterized protein n=1 Tax=Rangifer tarandus platyrhynchus TaxID=3082113 RepID=A0AC60A8V4_RANTA